MSRYKIKITELAEQDLENIGDYISNGLLNPLAATNTVWGILRKINSLERYPERNCLDSDIILAEQGVRAIYYKDYKIFYIIENTVIYVVRILHTRTDSKSRLYAAFSNPKGN